MREKRNLACRIQGKKEQLGKQTNKHTTTNKQANKHFFDFSNGTLLLKTILKQYTNEELFH